MNFRAASSSALWRLDQPIGLCPICRLPDGFHDHRGVMVHHDYLKEKGWEKKKDPPKSESPQ